MLSDHPFQFAEPFQFPFDRGHQHLCVDRFEEIVIGTEFLPGADENILVQSAQEDERCCQEFIDGAELLIEGEAAHIRFGEIDVADDDVGRHRFKQLETFLAGGRREAVISTFIEDPFDDAEEHLFIIQYEHRAVGLEGLEQLEDTRFDRKLFLIGDEEFRFRCDEKSVTPFRHSSRMEWR
jgi:hypothetical protein